MADNITLVGSGAVVASDEVDLGAGPAQVTYGKIIDAAADGTDRLRVEDGGLRTSARYLAFETPLGIAVASASYADGDQVGETFDLGVVPEGALLDYRAVLGCLDGVSVPAGLHLLIIPADLAVVAGATLGTDGTPPALSTFDAYDALHVPAADFTIPVLTRTCFAGATSPAGWRQPWARHSVLGNSGGNVHAWGMLVADGPIVTDYTTGLAVSVTCRYEYPTAASPF